MLNISRAGLSKEPSAVENLEEIPHCQQFFSFFFFLNLQPSCSYPPAEKRRKKRGISSNISTVDITTFFYVFLSLKKKKKKSWIKHTHACAYKHTHHQTPIFCANVNTLYYTLYKDPLLHNSFSWGGGGGGMRYSFHPNNKQSTGTACWSVISSKRWTVHLCCLKTPILHKTFNQYSMKACPRTIRVRFIISSTIANESISDSVHLLLCRQKS